MRGLCALLTVVALLVPTNAWAHERTLPAAWHLFCNLGDDYQAGITDADSHGGQWCAFLKSGLTKPKGFSTVNQSFKADRYRSKHLQFSGWYKPVGVEGEASLWLRIDGSDSKVLSFEQVRAIKGSSVWKPFHVKAVVPADSQRVTAGFGLAGVGTFCFDDIHFDVVDEPTAVGSASPAPHKHHKGRSTGFEK